MIRFHTNSPIGPRASWIGFYENEWLGVQRDKWELKRRLLETVGFGVGWPLFMGLCAIVRSEAWDGSLVLDEASVIRIVGVVAFILLSAVFVCFALSGPTRPKHAVPLATVGERTRQPVERILSEVSTSLGVKPSHVWMLRGDFHQGASVAIAGRRIDLYLPQGTLALARRDPDQLLAIIAHELAHVAHGDSGFWSTIRYGASLAPVLSAGVIAATVVFGLVAHLPVPSVGVLFLFFGGHLR